MSMKFRCDQEHLSHALNTAGRGVTNRTASTVVGGVQLRLKGDKLTVTGTDGDLAISVELEVAGSGDGEVVMRSKLMADVVRSLEAGEVKVEMEERSANIIGGRSEFKITTFASDEFPDMAKHEGDEVTLNGRAFKDAIDQVGKAASTDEARPILTGVLMAAENEGLRLVSTDSYRLAVRDIEGLSVLADEQSVLVPSQALRELARIVTDEDDIKLTLATQHASFNVGKTTVTTRLIQGDFPNYSRLIPDAHENRLTVNRNELLKTLRRVRLMAQESTPIRMTMNSEGLKVKAVTQDVGEACEAVEADYKGEDLMVAFNPDYLIDGIDVAPGSEVMIETLSELKPALLKSSEDPNFLYLLMPVRVS